MSLLETMHSERLSGLLQYVFVYDRAPDKLPSSNFSAANMAVHTCQSGIAVNRGSTEIVAAASIRSRLGRWQRKDGRR